MVATRSAPNRPRNVFIVGIVLGVIATLIVSALLPKSAVSSKDLDKLSERLSAIERKLATPTPAPAAASTASPSPGSTTITEINKDPTASADKVVDVTGKVNSPHQGVGFILVDNDGSFVWVHSKDKIPTGSVTVHGKVTKLANQINQWKQEPGWPEDDASLVTKLKNEKVFLETVGIS